MAVRAAVGYAKLNRTMLLGKGKFVALAGTVAYPRS